MFNKKAVSDVVSTVLIILLVVAAVAIVGAIVLKVVNNAGPKVDNAVSCQALEITANSCAKNAATPAGTAVRGSGGSSTPLTGIKFIYQDANGVTLGSADAAAGSNLAATFTPINAAALSTALSAAPSQMVVAGTIQGSNDLCPASQPVKCV